MITYNDIYEAAENNPLVFFDFPQRTGSSDKLKFGSTERQFLIASTEIALLLQEVNK